VSYYDDKFLIASSKPVTSDLILSETARAHLDFSDEIDLGSMSLTGTGTNAAMFRTTIKLYRDCIRLVNHVAGKSVKSQNLKRIIGGEFRKNRGVTDPASVDALRGDAVRGLANYLMMESAVKDERFREKIGKFSSNEAATLKVTDLPK
jgi:Complex 1 protein (LYR family)